MGTILFANRARGKQKMPSASSSPDSRPGRRFCLKSPPPSVQTPGTMHPKRPTLFSFLAALALFSLASVFSPAAHAQGTTTAPYADVTGSLDNFHIKTLSSGSLKVLGKLTLANHGAVAAKDVYATVYLSDDKTFDPEDEVYTINLADYNNGKGKLKAGSQIVLPLSKKVSSFLAGMITGQYVIIQFSAKNNTPDTADNHNVVVVGPITLP